MLTRKIVATIYIAYRISDDVEMQAFESQKAADDFRDEQNRWQDWKVKVLQFEETQR